MYLRIANNKEAKGLRTVFVKEREGYKGNNKEEQKEESLEGGDVEVFMSFVCWAAQSPPDRDWTKWLMRCVLLLLLPAPQYVYYWL